MKTVEKNWGFVPSSNLGIETPIVLDSKQTSKKVMLTSSFKSLFALGLGLILCSTSSMAQNIPYSGGRIAISSDGNEHDKDDWAATPFSLALLAAKGLQDNLVLYTFSDHVWGSNHDNKNAVNEMRESALVGGQKFGFTKTNFIEAVANPSAAYAAMTAEINKSTAANPLTIIAAGPMQVVGTALNNADQTKLQFVRIISHSLWNDKHADKPSSWEKHSGWTWAEIQSTFQKKGLKISHIVDQNGGSGYDGMRASKTKFAWLNTSPARNQAPYQSGAWAWLYGRQVAAQKGTEFDPSDAGMIIYLLTGKEKTNPSDAQYIMEHPVTNGGGSVVTPPLDNGGTISDINDLALSKNNCAVVLTWSDVSAETGYRVRRKVQGESTYTNIADVDANLTTYTDNTARAGVNYTYMVRPLVNGTAVKISNTPSITVGNCATPQARSLSMEVSVLPNPFANDFVFEVQNNQGEVKATMFDDFGNEVFVHQTSLDANLFQINTSNLRQGIYYLSVQDSNNQVITRVYKQ